MPLEYLGPSGEVQWRRQGTHQIVSAMRWILKEIIDGELKTRQALKMQDWTCFNFTQIPYTLLKLIWSFRHACNHRGWSQPPKIIIDQKQTKVSRPGGGSLIWIISYKFFIWQIKYRNLSEIIWRRKLELWSNTNFVLEYEGWFSPSRLNGTGLSIITPNIYPFILIPHFELF